MLRLSYSSMVFGVCSAAAMLTTTMSVTADDQQPRQVRVPRKIPAPDDLLIQHPEPLLRPSLVESRGYLRVASARTTHNVDGAGLACAVMDTGLRVTHNDFTGRVPVVRNFTTDDGGNVNLVTDGNGHGSHVAGIVAANGTHLGFAPGASIIPLKVLRNSGGGTYASLEAAVDWVIANRVSRNISCVNMSLGFGDNPTSDSGFSSDAIRTKIASLRTNRVAVVCAAGNSFFNFSSAQGMAYPAICRETVSVGALFDANIGSVSYGSGATAFSTDTARITPFSQRLHPDVNADCRTDIFSTGAALTATGNGTDTASSTLHGTSQAAPTVAGLILLAQQLHVRNTGQLPTVTDLETWLRTNTFTEVDGDNEDDNVINTNKTFLEADAIVFLGNVPSTPPPPPAGNVAVSFSNGELFLVGDNNANTVTLAYTKTTVTVTPGAATTLNGSATPLSFTLGKGQKFNLSIQSNGGADAFTINSAPLEICSIGLGAGADSCNLNFCKIKNFTLDGGTEVDTLTLNGTKLPKKKTSIFSVP